MLRARKRLSSRPPVLFGQRSPTWPPTGLKAIYISALSPVGGQFRLAGPPVALALDVFARRLAEIGRADDEDLEALRPGLIASPHTGRDAYRIPFPELDDLL